MSVQLDEGEQAARQQLDADRAFRADNTRWARCMNQAGFTEKDPTSLLAALPRDADLAMNPAARADVRCKAETGYLPAAYTRLAAVQQAWLHAHAATLDTWNALQRRQDAVARAVLHLT